MREAVISSDGVRLVLRVMAYERPTLGTGADANWVTGEAEMTISGGDVFRAHRGVAFRAEQLARFRDDLRRLLADLEGEAILDHMEDEVGCTIRLRKGTGELDAFIRQHVPFVELRVHGVPTDQSYLQETLRQLDALVAEFPVKG